MKRFLSLIFLVLSLVMLSSCKETETNSEKIRFVASCYPVFVSAVNIIKDVENTEIVCMNSSAEGCFHNYQIQTDDLKNIENSAGFIINGADFEPFAEKIVLNLPKTRIIDASENIELIEEYCDHDHDYDEDIHNHGHVNSHTWLSVENNIQQVKNILKGICDIDSKNSEKYTKNANEYIKKLEILKSEMHEKLVKFRGTKIVTYHNSFNYLAKELELEIVDAVNAESDEQPDTKEIAEIIESAKEKGVKAIFYESKFANGKENYIPAKICEMIKEETGIASFGLFSGTSGNLSNDMYIQIMNENIKILEKALA